MGLIEELSGKRVYLDTNIFIYLIEGNATFQPIIEALGTALSDGDFSAFSSHITLTEILPPLVKRGEEDMIAGTIELMTQSGLVSLAPADTDVCIQAGFLRGELGMKTPDALHVATAVYQGCDIFLTNDAGIRVPSSMKRLLLSDFL
jgi:predicted nucleic acid-binding protein